MTRQDQIKEMAKFHARCMTCDKDMQVAFADALRRGAEWSDAHPDIDVRTMAAWRSGYQAAIDTHPHWISVEDELPKTETEVLMVSSGSADILYGYRSKVGKNRWYCYDDDDFCHNITHWMPLPEPPVVSKSEHAHIIGTAGHIKIALDVIEKGCEEC